MKIVIVVWGGVVETVYTDSEDIEIAVVDEDSYELGTVDEGRSTIKLTSESSEAVVDSHVARYDPDLVEAVYSVLEEEDEL